MLQPREEPTQPVPLSVPLSRPAAHSPHLLLALLPGLSPPIGTDCSSGAKGSLERGHGLGTLRRAV